MTPVKGSLRCSLSSPLRVASMSQQRVECNETRVGCAKGEVVTKVRSLLQGHDT